jgi:hypothetical protein
MIKKNEKGDFKMASPAPYFGSAPTDDAVEGKERLNFNVSPVMAAETRQLAESLNMSMTQLFKYAMSILKIAAEESRNNKRKLCITDRNNNVLREFILPGLD